jgi:hypothetical protein
MRKDTHADLENNGSMASANFWIFLHIKYSHIVFTSMLFFLSFEDF